MKIPCTVGILTKNSGKTLKRALESVKDCAEIIISDGGSTDSTIIIAEKYADHIAKHEDVTHRQTIAEGRNNGAAIASGEI